MILVYTPYLLYCCTDNDTGIQVRKAQRNYEFGSEVQLRERVEFGEERVEPRANGRASRLVGGRVREERAAGEGRGGAAVGVGAEQRGGVLALALVGGGSGERRVRAGEQLALVHLRQALLTALGAQRRLLPVLEHLVHRLHLPLHVVVSLRKTRDTRMLHLIPGMQRESTTNYCTKRTLSLIRCRMCCSSSLVSSGL